MVQIRSDGKFFCGYLKRKRKTYFKYFSSDYVTERVVQEFFSQIFKSVLQFEITQEHTYMRKNINTSICLKLMQFKWRKSTADLLRGHIMWRIFQVDFFVTDSVVPEPAKTILIILYCILVTIAGEHHTIATIAIIITIIIDTISIIIITKIEIISFANSSLPAQSSAFQVFLPITINISSAASFPSVSETKIPHSFFIIDHVVDCSMQCRRWWQMEH